MTASNNVSYDEVTKLTTCINVPLMKGAFNLKKIMPTKMC